MKTAENVITMISENIFPPKKAAVFNVLETLCRNGRIAPECWPKTREIANGCDDSVFVTRYWLGLLEKDGLVSSSVINGSAGGRGNSLRWCPKRCAKSACITPSLAEKK